MEVKCPHCDSRFNLPDTIKPGAKLRCSVCESVFTLPSPDEAAKAAPAAPRRQEPAMATPPFSVEEEEERPRGRRLLPVLLAVLLVLLLASGGAAFWWFFLGGADGGGTDPSAPVAANDPATPPPADPPQAKVDDKLRLLSMRKVHQYYVENETVGKVFVIDGVVVNGFDTPKALIAVEAAIYDKDKKPLAVKRQLAGTQLSLFQLQVVREKDMESFLTNKVDIVTANTNVQPGAEVPFMILFYPHSREQSQAFAESIKEFGLRIVDVQDASAVSGF